jgi:hypothetical protein
MPVPRPSGLLLVVAAELVSRGECPLPEVALVYSTLLLEGGVLFGWCRLMSPMLLVYNITVNFLDQQLQKEVH